MQMRILRAYCVARGFTIIREYSRQARLAWAALMSAALPMTNDGCWRMIFPVAGSVYLLLKCPNQEPLSLVIQPLWYRTRAKLQLSDVNVNFGKVLVLLVERE